jgi:4-hydroxy-tetrahydrodipicolinate synthase
MSAKYFLQKRGLPVRTISRATALQLTPEQRKTLDEIHDSFLHWCERLDIKPVTIEKLTSHNKEYYLVK